VELEDFGDRRLERDDPQAAVGGVLTAVGAAIQIAAAAHSVPVTLELGGKSPAIIDASCNLDGVADRLAWGKLINAGQTCIAPDYALVPEASVRDFADRVQGHMRRMFGTDPDNKDYTSVVSDRHYARLEHLVADAAAKGATIMQAAKPDQQGWKSKRKFPPTIVVGATPEMAIMQEEIFGPVLPIMGYRDAHEPIAYINKHDRPLALYWFGKDNAARGALRRSSTTPTAWVGTRANRRGPGLPDGDVMGTVLLSKLRCGETDANRPFHCGTAPINGPPRPV